MAMDAQNVTALIGINLPVAFNTMNHQIILNMLDKFCEIKEKARQWFESYLENRSNRSQIDNSFSDTLHLPFSVAQGGSTSPI